MNKGIPDTFVVTNAVEHDKTDMDSLVNNKHCIHVFDKTYWDYQKFDQYTKNEKYFITRLENNTIITEVITFAIFKLIEPLIETKTALIGIKRAIKDNLF